MLSRIIYGGRASFAIGFGAVAFGMVIGGFLGLVTGFFRGIVRHGPDPADEHPAGHPAVRAGAVPRDRARRRRRRGQTCAGRRSIILGLGLVSIPILGRITRANTLQWSEREFVMASKAMGAKSFRTLFREVLPNVVPAMLSIALLGVGVAIVAEGGLSLFGVGVQGPTPSWGNIIAENKGALRTSPHIVMFTTIVLFLTVLALNYLGDVVSRRFAFRESVL